MRVERGEGHISTLAIHPEWRGWGLGELLLHRALEQAIESDAHTISLEVRVSNNMAQTLYAKYGFATVSRLRGYYADGEDAYLMRADVIRRLTNTANTYPNGRWLESNDFKHNPAEFPKTVPGGSRWTSPDEKMR